MSEMRCIIFNDNELMRAVVLMLQTAKRQLPRGTFKKLLHDRTDPTRYGTLVFLTDEGTEQEFNFSKVEIASALLAYCIDRRVMVPRRAIKKVEFIGSDIALILQIPSQQQTAKKAA